VKIVRIRRFSGSTSGTLAEWTIAGTPFRCVGMARPWKNNEPFVSCIPPDVYKLVLGTYNAGDGGKGYPAYEVMGVTGRSLIKLHAANKASQLEGCESPGRYVFVMDGELAVSSSRNTLNEFMAYMDSEPEAVLEVT